MCCGGEYVFVFMLEKCLVLEVGYWFDSVRVNEIYYRFKYVLINVFEVNFVCGGINVDISFICFEC